MPGCNQFRLSGAASGETKTDSVIRTYIPVHRGPQAPLNAAPPLAREFDARVAVAGKTWGLGGKLTFSERVLPSL